MIIVGCGTVAGCVAHRIDGVLEGVHCIEDVLFEIMKHGLASAVIDFGLIDG